MTTTSSWRCLVCEAGETSTDAGAIDKAAEKHTKTAHHGTVTSHRPKETR